MPLFPIGRRAKDAKALQQAQKTGGSVMIRSRNKIANPAGAGTLARGSTVTYKKMPTITKEPDTVVEGKRHITVTPSEKQVYQPGDMQGNKVHDRPTTMDLGKSLKERPSKTIQRMKAQGEGKTEYTTPSGNKEYAGRIASIPSQTTTITKDPDRVIPGKVTVGERSSVSVSEPAAKKESGKSSGHSGLTIHHSSGVNRQGKPQNYTSVELGGKKLMKFKRATPGTGSRSRSLRK